MLNNSFTEVHVLRNGEICDTFLIGEVDHIQTRFWFDVEFEKEHYDREVGVVVHLEHFDKTPKRGRILEVYRKDSSNPGIYHMHLYNADRVTITF